MAKTAKEDKKLYEETEEDKKLLSSLEVPKISSKNFFRNTIDLTPVDIYNLNLEEYRFIKKNKELVALLRKKSRFSSEEIEGLLLIFHKFTCQRDVMLKEEFHDVLSNTLEITDDFMVHHIITEILSSTKLKRFISMSVWVETFSLFLRGTFEEKIKHCYRVYDNTQKGFIGRDILFT